MRLEVHKADGNLLASPRTMDEPLRLEWRVSQKHWPPQRCTSREEEEEKEEGVCVWVSGVWQSRPVPL